MTKTPLTAAESIYQVRLLTNHNKLIIRDAAAVTYPSHKNETRDAIDVTRAIMALVDPSVEPELALGQMLEYNEWLALYPTLKHITVKGIDIDLTSGEVAYLTKYAGHTVWFSKASIDGGGLVPLWKDGSDDIEEEEDKS